MNKCVVVRGIEAGKFGEIRKRVKKMLFLSFVGKGMTSGQICLLLVQLKIRMKM